MFIQINFHLSLFQFFNFPLSPLIPIPSIHYHRQSFAVTRFAQKQIGISIVALFLCHNHIDHFAQFLLFFTPLLQQIIHGLQRQSGPNFNAISHAFGWQSAFDDQIFLDSMRCWAIHCAELLYGLWKRNCGNFWYF